MAVCPADGMSTDISIAALDQTTVLTVWAFDSAGNVSVPLHNANGSTYAFTVGMGSVRPTTFVELQLNGAQWTTPPQRRGQHLWSETVRGHHPPGGGSANADLPQRHLDRANGRTGHRPVAELQRLGMVLPHLSDWHHCPGPDHAVDQHRAGCRTQARTDGKPELVAWTGTGATETVIGQDLVSGRWAYVSAIYDRINAQLRITKTDTNSTGTWIKAASPPVAHKTAAPSNPVQLGGSFVGNIYKPILTQAS